MRLFPPHFACPALLQNIPRHTIVRSKFARFSAPARAFQTRRTYSVQSAVGAIDDDMGKDDKSKNFNLKVPKGTRDCMLRPLLQRCAACTEPRCTDIARDWRGCRSPRSPLRDRDHRLQAPRRHDSRHTRLRAEGNPQRQIWRGLEAHL